MTRQMFVLGLLVLAPVIPASAQSVPADASQDMRVVQNVPYAETDHDRQTLDLFLPAIRPDKPLPVVVFIHGGAWRGGHKRAGRRWLQPYVRSGEYAGVSIGYRLSQHATWPAQIHDCKAAIRWIRANADKHRLDPKRIGVMGTSAGGHLVAMLGTSGGVESLAGGLGPHTKQSSRVACVVDFFGPSELLSMGDYPSRIDHDATDSPESRLVGGAIQQHPDRAQSASPITYVSKDDPPFLIVHGTDDQLVPFNQSVRLRDALSKHHVDVALLTVAGGGHGGFGHPDIHTAARSFFDKHLRDLEARFEDRIIQHQPQLSTAP